MKGPKKIKWPKDRSAEQLRKMSLRSQLRYARHIHRASAQRYRRSMEWDLFWAEFYDFLLKQKARQR